MGDTTNLGDQELAQRPIGKLSPGYIISYDQRKWFPISIVHSSNSCTDLNYLRCYKCLNVAYAHKLKQKVQHGLRNSTTFH